MLISSFMHMMHPPMIHVVHPSGAPIGTAEDVARNPELAASDAVDPGDPAGVGDADGDGFSDGEDYAGDSGGGDFDGGGGDFDGGGGDFGGGDLGGGFD
jgi:hypothetical protein